MGCGVRLCGYLLNLGMHFRAEKVAPLGLLHTRAVVRFLETGFSGRAEPNMLKILPIIPS